MDENPEHDEDPLEHVGPEIPDPWDDEEQTDWTNRTIVLGEN